MNAHELAKLLLDGPDLPVELWVHSSTSAINGECKNVELSDDEKTVQLSTWKD